VGSKYGELLLKSIFATAHERGVRSLYVEVLVKHEALLELLERFGFEASGHRTARGELVYAKSLRGSPDGLSALDYHVRYGPPAIAGTGQIFLVRSNRTGTSNSSQMPRRRCRTGRSSSN